MPRPTRLEETRPTGHGRARGLVSSRKSGSRVEARTFAPSADLRPLVATYWMGRWDLRGQAPHTTELLGDPCVHFVFEHGRSRIVGVWTRLWTRTLEGQGHVRAVKLKAGAVRAFVDRPVADLTNTIAPLASVVTSDIAHLERAILDPTDEPDAFAHLETWLRQNQIPHDTHRLTLATSLVDQISSTPTLTTVEALADQAHLTVRQLQRLFRDYVGAPPKWLIRRIRLQEVALQIEKGQPPNLAHLAADLGYADQAHLTRDFKTATGQTPTQFAKTNST